MRRGVCPAILLFTRGMASASYSLILRQLHAVIIDLARKETICLSTLSQRLLDMVLLMLSGLNLPGRSLLEYRNELDIGQCCQLPSFLKSISFLSS
jgi:hypothetical protein